MTRPHIHLAPERNWMNDPNGLVFHDGTYHAFFQYNPHGVNHAHIHWGHASSTDLVHWEEQPVAIHETGQHQIYSGSAVVDADDTSGLGVDGVAPLVAIYTLAGKEPPHQAQGISSSTDRGRTWTAYPNNPVLDRDSSDFRDPKVFRYDGPAGSYWVMVAVEALDRQVVFYRSADLTNWTYLSTYGPRGATGGIWECPDMFPLALDGDPDDIRWVLVISLNPGGIAGGSGTQYVVGSFDGQTFTPDEPGPPAAPVEGWLNTSEQMQACSWLDRGRDCYAGVTFSGLPHDERILMAWMNNWDYASDLPPMGNGDLRGSMTLARRLSLVTREGAVRLRQEPVGPRVTSVEEFRDVELADGDEISAAAPSVARLRVRLRLRDDARAVLTLGDDDRPAAVITLDEAGLGLDRRGGAEGLPGTFGSVERMPLSGGREVDILLWLDEGSVEIFADDGTTVLTALIGLRGCDRVSARAERGEVTVIELAIAAADV